ncbi:hypothetical protein RRG08_028207 [Elysia crispata]|uniref:Uncharacterized protein n=1 Tax=Elysia crispata TaxID=231223 RepID=A0AAE1CVP2_9GAST|nr:hypothetical protein RRG08_028207 [Elysia crispata]
MRTPSLADLQLQLLMTRGHPVLLISTHVTYDMTISSLADLQMHKFCFSSWLLYTVKPVKSQDLISTADNRTIVPSNTMSVREIPSLQQTTVHRRTMSVPEIPFPQQTTVHCNTMSVLGIPSPQQTIVHSNSTVESK